MNYNELSNEEKGREMLHKKGALGHLEGFAEYENRQERAGKSNEYGSRMHKIVSAAMDHANDNFKDTVLMTDFDIKSLRTWPDGEQIDPEELKDMIKVNGGYLDVMIDRECEDMETGEPKLNDDSPLSLRGAEFEQGELILITETGVYSTVNFNAFEHDRDYGIER